MKIISAVFFSIAIVMICDALWASTTLETKQNTVIEWSYTSSKTYKNPFRDVKLMAEIVSSHGEKKVIPAFWAGGNKWSFRFSSNAVGSYQFKTTCNDRKNKSLHNQKGSIEVQVYEGENPLYKHGTLKISKDQKHLTHLDGTPFLWLADSWWHGMTTRFTWPDDFKYLTADRKTKGFSVIQFAIGFPCDIEPYDPRGQNEAGDPWDNEFRSINPAYFDFADQRIQHLLDQSLLPNIVGAWGYYIKFAGVENMKKHWDYLIARYGAYPVTWTLCGEATLAYYDDLADNWDFYKKQFRSQWSEVAGHIQSTDPYNRLLTVHPGPGILDGHPPIDDMSCIDFVMLQSGHDGFHNLPRSTRMIKEYLKTYQDRPVMHGEVCFEGMHGGGSGEKVQRFLFWTNMLMGTCGFSYGVEGIWQFNTEEELFGVSPGGNNWGNVPWEIAHQYNGGTQIGIGKSILEEYEWWKLEPRPDLVETRQEDVFAPYCASIDDEVLMVYLSRFPARWRKDYITNLNSAKDYNLIYIDPITGDKYPQGKIAADDNGKFEIPPVPIMQDWVLVLEKEE